MIGRHEPGSLLLEDEPTAREAARKPQRPARSLDEVIESTANEIAAAFKTRKRKVAAKVKEDA